MSGFTNHLLDLFAGVGPVRLRRMFGGYGVYCDEVMFGLVADDVLYLKVDEVIQSHFDTRALPAFEYNKDGKRMAMSYRQAPEEIFDDADEAVIWARRSIEAALRSRANKKRRQK